MKIKDPRPADGVSKRRPGSAELLRFGRAGARDEALRRVSEATDQQTYNQIHYGTLYINQAQEGFLAAVKKSGKPEMLAFDQEDNQRRTSNEKLQRGYTNGTVHTNYRSDNGNGRENEVRV